ncbi:uncharacterized protein HMPREF1541_07002 [Cyphellophora europaea CBS 101466]|uniref:5-Methylcytosine G/T mismatch-specific DNA glycosylase n=1 Tax=Cyphellophora europaea (strain CBS 101466) TaxID=1220924 RepID=W2RRM5_CYPE1|nr:uncharacterized protein HMPREF1541_07002 [Cyphellophora europaea CBS 101466]ETN38960.1 hypothetical protein HMPREF1541_07002 [Cyphellophora europaea CBS 101466]
MPSKLREKSPERRRERKESSKDDKEKRHRHKTHSSRKSSSKEKSTSRTSLNSDGSQRRSSMPEAISEAEEKPIPKSESKSSLPYPSFSKLHSKEAIGPRPPNGIFTPTATDLDASKEKLSQPRSAAGTRGPPSPPLTDQTAGRKTSKVKPVRVETIDEEDKKESSDRDSKIRIRLQPKSSRSNGHLRSSSDLGSTGSPTKTKEATTSPLKPRELDGGVKRSVSQPTRKKTPEPDRTSPDDVGSSSDGTSIAPVQPNIQRPGSRIPPGAGHDGVRSHVTSLNDAQSRGTTPLEVFGSPHSSAYPASAAPPPPPPPPVVSVPRVDYLLQHGGLHYTVPKNLLLSGKPMAIQQAMTPSQEPVVVANLFEPYHQLLDDFDRVISKNGSLAVATGYKSVARRLLDRLEAVFARDISNEFCQCCMCAEEHQQGEDVRGVSWGEILELVAGRQELPIWPPFSLVGAPVGLGIAAEPHAPMQKLDIDVPEEYREHYIRQSRKTKQSVDKWLNRQNDAPTSPPEEFDDETLTFAMLTHLPVEQRQLYKNLLCIVDRPLEPPRRAPSPEKGAPPEPVPTPAPRERPAHIVLVGEAIQRLYRLHSPPRDPETAIFMLNNPQLHNALATLAAVSNDEWEILISGRFDGFLRSGADDAPAPDMPLRKPLSRGATPAQGRMSASGFQHARPNSTGPGYGRSATPGTATRGAPIAFDEETEIATLAEIERDIYQGMEVLEDAFEQLHVKAEAVRRALAERAAGLSAASHRRRGSAAGGVEVRMGTPGSGLGVGFDGLRGPYGGGVGTGMWESETDDGLGDWDGVSELAPDDSASNISSSRRRRPKRRDERAKARRTPMIEEEDAESEGTESPTKGF